MSFSFENKIGLICGSSRGIGFALSKHLLEKENIKKLFITVRDKEDVKLLEDEFSRKLNVCYLEASDPESYKKLQLDISAQTKQLDFIINSIGVLNLNSKAPEKRINDFESENLIESIKVNTLPSLLLAKEFKSHLRQSEQPLFCSISAKVGSILDNKSGGWYSYRISKAALNMALKNLSIELSQLNNKAIVAAIHPGTTDTDLSKPFLANARKKYIIHQASETAKNIVETLKLCENGDFRSWDKNLIGW